jgi:DNA-binding response OmpR family regulator
MSLLDRLSFDLVITDGFSREPGAVFVNTADLVRSAYVTPVALFSAHRLDRDLALVAGFRDVITKPFDLDTLIRQVKGLLADLPVNGTPDPLPGEATWQPARTGAYSNPTTAS